jgi:Helix-turn-helix domain
MARNRAKRAGLRSHRSYTIDEAANALSLCKATVRRWIKVGQIKPIDDLRPAMLAGADLIALTTKANKQKQRCKANEAYCLRCRAIRPMAFDEAEVLSANASGANLRALCGTCSTLIHKRVSLRALPDLAQSLTLRAPLALQHLINTQKAPVNVHLETPAKTLPKPFGEGAPKSPTQTATGAVGQSTLNPNTVSMNPIKGA